MGIEAEMNDFGVGPKDRICLQSRLEEDGQYNRICEAKLNT